MDVTSLFQNTTPLFTALGDPVRQHIVVLLAERSRSVNELADSSTLSQPAISHHLKILSHARLVTSRRDGTRRIYSLTPYAGIEALKQLISAIETACPEEKK